MGGSYETITLRSTNVRYVASVTGKSEIELRKLLKRKAEDGIFEIKLPIGIDYFTTDRGDS